MKVVRTRANATEINKTPRDTRYIWVVKFLNSTVTTCMTYQTIRRVRPEDVTYLMVVDLKSLELIILNPKGLNSLLEDWRENYFDYDWNIPGEYLFQ